MSAAHQWEVEKHWSSKKSKAYPMKLAQPLKNSDTVSLKCEQREPQVYLQMHNEDFHGHPDLRTGNKAPVCGQGCPVTGISRPKYWRSAIWKITVVIDERLLPVRRTPAEAREQSGCHRGKWRRPGCPGWRPSEQALPPLPYDSSAYNTKRRR